MRLTASVVVVATALLAIPGSSLNHLINRRHLQVSSRRQLFQQTSVASLAFGSLLLPSLATEPAAASSLLEEFGKDPAKIDDKAAASSAPRVAVSKPKEKSAIEPNLRSNYYYPTNKQRYLPRIKKCNDMIGDVSVAIGNEDWSAVETFAKDVADDTILPMKLYTSSLTGQGTNVKVLYAKTMNADAAQFETNQKAMLKAVAKRNPDLASQALEGMATALQDYRTVGGLTGPDGGGDIPSLDDIRRAAIRNQKVKFEQAIKTRDIRVAEVGSS